MLNLTLKCFKSTLEEASKSNTDNESLVSKNDEVCLFDSVAKKVSKKLCRGNTVCSCDAFFSDQDGNKYFFEFKNSPEKNIDIPNIRSKAFNSVYVLQTAFYGEESLSKITENLILFIIYNADKVEERQSHTINTSESLSKIVSKFAKSANKPSPTEIKFGLEKLKGLLYSDIYTIDVKEFMSLHYPKLFCKSDKDEEHD